MHPGSSLDVRDVGECIKGSFGEMVSVCVGVGLRGDPVAETLPHWRLIFLLEVSSFQSFEVRIGSESWMSLSRLVVGVLGRNGKPEHGEFKAGGSHYRSGIRSLSKV